MVDVTMTQVLSEAHSGGNTVNIVMSSGTAYSGTVTTDPAEFSERNDRMIINLQTPGASPGDDPTNRQIQISLIESIQVVPTSP